LISQKQLSYYVTFSQPPTLALISAIRQTLERRVIRHSSSSWSVEVSLAFLTSLAIFGGDDAFSAKADC
jgi:hypothetical protein